MQINGRLNIIDATLRDARRAISEGRLVEARHALRVLAWEADDAAVSLNAAIAEANIKIAEGA